MGGIAGLLSALSALGFLALLVGVALVVVGISQGRPMRGGIILAVAGLLVGGLFGIISQGILIIAPQQVAVVFQTVTGELGTPLQAGTHIIVPVLQEATIYPISFQQYTMSGISDDGQVTGDDAVRVRTIDGQEVVIDVTLIYRINPDEVNLVHQRWQNRYTNDLIRPILRGFVRDVVSRFRAEAVYGESRGEIQGALQEEVRNRMAQDGFEVSDLVIRNVTFSSEEFALSIERVQIAERQALEAGFRVQQEEQEAERIRVRAAGARDAAIAEAEGQANAILLLAESQAEALRLVSVVLKDNPNLIQYEYVQRLADNVNLILLPSNSPLLFDPQSLMDAAATTAP